MDVRKVRRFLELRQIDVSLATGLTVETIRIAERGEYVHPHFRAVLELYLSKQLRDEVECNKQRQGQKTLAELLG